MMFFNRMHRHFRNKCKCINHENKHSINPDHLSLDKAQEDLNYQIMSNQHRKSFELGLYNGNQITIVRNDANQRNLIIAVGESRYIISKDIAKFILIREIATAS